MADEGNVTPTLSMNTIAQAAADTPNLWSEDSTPASNNQPPAQDAAPQDKTVDAKDQDSQNDSTTDSQSTDEPNLETKPEGEETEATGDKPTEEKPAETKPEEKPEEKKEGSLPKQWAAIKREKAMLSQERAEIKKEKEQIQSHATQINKLVEKNKEWASWFETFKSNPYPILDKLFPNLLTDLQERTLNGGRLTQRDLDRQLEAERERMRKQNEELVSKAEERARQEAWATNFRTETAKLCADAGYSEVNDYLLETKGNDLYSEVATWTSEYMALPDVPKEQKQALTASKAVQIVVKHYKDKLDKLRKKFGGNTSQAVSNTPPKANTPRPVTNKDVSAPSGNRPKVPLKYDNIVDAAASMMD